MLHMIIGSWCCVYVSEFPGRARCARAEYCFTLHVERICCVCTYVRMNACMYVHTLF